MPHERVLALEKMGDLTSLSLSKGSDDYVKLVKSILSGKSFVVKGAKETQRIRDWLGRRPDSINSGDHQKNLNKHHSGTGHWLLEDPKFREWANPESSSMTQ